jgi:diguanylate cyclase (GGDEF)-like protein
LLHEDTEISVTVSLGVVEYASKITDLDALIKGADLALYAAKTAGRNRIEIYRFEDDKKNG